MSSSLFHTVLAVSVFALVSCGGNLTADTATPTANESVSEVAVGSVAGAAQAAESAGTLAMIDQLEQKPSFFSLVSSARAACTAFPTGVCKDGVYTLTFSNNCQTMGKGVNWTGKELLTFVPAAACNSRPDINTSGTMTRTFTDGTYRTAPDGVRVYVNTTTASGYNASKSGGTTVTFAPGTKSISINGIHYVAIADYKNKAGDAKTATVWDHTVSTDSPIVVTGTGASKTIAAGMSVRTQHNIKKFTGVTTVTNQLGFSDGCCYPTSGSISTTLSGSKTGTESITFTNTCGTATLTDNNGTTADLSLTHCF